MPRLAFIGLVFFAVTAACSANGPAAPADGSSDLDTARSDASQEGDAAADADLPRANCQQIRLCVAAGGGLDACLARGTPAAQAIFMGLVACLQPNCPELLSGCVCRETCQADGFCLDQTDACLTDSGGTIDAVCETYCG